MWTGQGRAAEGQPSRLSRGGTTVLPAFPRLQKRTRPRMRVLVNAAAVKEGGPLVVFDQLLQQMARPRDDVDWFIAAHRGLEWRWNGQIDVGNIDAGPFGVPETQRGSVFTSKDV